MHNIKRTAMQTDKTDLSMAWSFVFTAIASGDLLYVGYCCLSLILFIHKKFWELQKSVTFRCNLLYGVWFIRLFSKQEINNATFDLINLPTLMHNSFIL